MSYPAVVQSLQASTCRARCARWCNSGDSLEGNSLLPFQRDFMPDIIKLINRLWLEIPQVQSRVVITVNLLNGPVVPIKLPFRYLRLYPQSSANRQPWSETLVLAESDGDFRDSEPVPVLRAGVCWVIRPNQDTSTSRAQRTSKNGKNVSQSSGFDRAIVGTQELSASVTRKRPAQDWASQFSNMGTGWTYSIHPSLKSYLQFMA